MAEKLLKTKLYIPPLRPVFIPRPHLVEQLNQGLQQGSKLVLVSAPAGFGKTTLLAEWVAQIEAPVAWLSLDMGDNDMARFLAYLAATLDTLRPEAGQELMTPLQSGQPPPVEQTLVTLLNEVAQVDNHSVLVLDDFHLIENQAIHDAVAFLLEHQPPQMHLALVGRADPIIPLPKLRAQGQMIEIREADLRFTVSEATTFLQRTTGMELPAEDLAALWERTEGWVVGLQLTALSMHGRDDITRFIASLAGSHEFIADYLQDEVLNQQTEEIQRFLLCTSILSRLTGSLCEAVTGLGEGQQTLETLKGRNLFLISLDDERRWYRYHSLFADLLRQRLMQRLPESVPELHRRASEWYEVHGWRPEAIEHALEGGDLDRAAGLVELAAEETLIWGEITTLINWVNRLPENLVRDQPSLCVYVAWALLLNGRSLEIVMRWLQDLKTGPEEMSPWVMPLYAFIALFQDQVERAAELSRQALALLPEEERYLRSMAVYLLNLATLFDVDATTGSLLMEETVKQARATGNVTIAVQALCNQGKLRLLQGQLHEAQAIYRRGLQLATDPEGRQLPVAGVALCGLGELSREWNETAAAEAYLTDGIALARQWSELATLDGYVSLSMLRKSLGDQAGALHVLQEALAIAEGSDVTEVDDWMVNLARARLNVAQGNLAEAWAWALSREFGRDGRPLNVDPEDDTIDSRKRKYELIIFARLLLAENRPAASLAHLERALLLFERRGRTRSIIEVLVLTALAHNAANDRRNGLKALGRAVRLAEPGGYIRLFVDEGPPMAHLLADLQQENSRAAETAYIGRLLAAFPAVGGLDAQRAEGELERQQDVIEPLSPREREVLVLIAEGHSNREIAATLIISLSTVKVHTRNIYSKLGVHTRTQAVAQARALGILS